MAEISRDAIANALGLNEAQLDHLIKNAKNVGKVSQSGALEKALDGGPLSHAQFAVTQIPTITVKIKKNNAVAIINKEDFNPELHVKLAEPKAPAPPVEESLISATPDADLPTLPLGDLKKLPEYLELASEQGEDQLKTKQQIVDAVLAYRKAHRKETV